MSAYLLTITVKMPLKRTILMVLIPVHYERCATVTFHSLRRKIYNSSFGVHFLVKK